MKLQKKSRGFTLIELLIGLAILSILAVLVTAAFNGDRTKAQTMLSLGKQVGEANISLKTDTGCYVKNPSALFDVTAANVEANNYCSRKFDKTWARPYLPQHPANADGNLMMDKIASGVILSLGQEKDSTTGMTRYFVSFDSVPASIIKNALLECNSKTDKITSFKDYRCRTNVDPEGNTDGKFEVLYDATR